MGTKEDLINAVVDIDEEKVYQIVKEMIAKKTSPQEIISFLREGVEIIGNKFNKKEYFLTELVMAGEMFTQAASILEPIMEEEITAGASKETIVIGTVEGDVHDIGKNIFVTLLKSAGFKTIDLGVNIPPEKFIEKVKETNAKVVAFSGLLTIAMESMKATVEGLKNAGLRDGVKEVLLHLSGESSDSGINVSCSPQLEKELQPVFKIQRKFWKI